MPVDRNLIWIDCSALEGMCSMLAVGLRQLEERLGTAGISDQEMEEKIIEMGKQLLWNNVAFKGSLFYYKA